MLEAEVYYCIMIDTPNDMPSDLKQTAKIMMVGRKNNKKQDKKTSFFQLIEEYLLCEDPPQKND